MASVWVRQVSTTSHGKRGWLQTPAAAPVSPRTAPLVTQSSPRRAGIPHASPWHHPRMTTEHVALTAARARTCWALMCAAKFCILTPSLGMSPVSLGTVSAPKPPWEAPNPLGTDSHPPCTLAVSALSAAPQPGRLFRMWPRELAEEHPAPWKAWSPPAASQSPGFCHHRLRGKRCSPPHGSGSLDGRSSWGPPCLPGRGLRGLGTRGCWGD